MELLAGTATSILPRRQTRSLRDARPICAGGTDCQGSVRSHAGKHRYSAADGAKSASGRESPAEPGERRTPESTLSRPMRARAITSLLQRKKRV